MCPWTRAHGLLSWRNKEKSDSTGLEPGNIVAKPAAIVRRTGKSLLAGSQHAANVAVFLSAVSKANLVAASRKTFYGWYQPTKLTLLVAGLS